jgi:hypothetical protein
LFNDRSRLHFNQPFGANQAVNDHKSARWRILPVHVFISNSLDLRNEGWVHAFRAVEVELNDIVEIPARSFDRGFSFSNTCST